MLGGAAFGVTRALTGSDSQPVNQTQEETVSEPVLYTVLLDKNKKEPISMTIRAGEYIQFNSEDGGQHQIMPTGEGEHGQDALSSPVFGGAEGYRIQFKDIGQFELKDNFEPDQMITVQVQ